MDSNWNDRRNADWAAVGDSDFSRRGEDSSGDYRASEESSGYGSRHTSPPGNPYGTRQGESSGYGLGYSTANDFSGQRPARGRLHHPEHRRDYRGYDEEDYPRYREMYRRTEYPETYRSAMSGYTSEHVGSDSGRRDYNQHPGSGNLYGNTYGPFRGNATRGAHRAHGYMSEDDYDRGTRSLGRTAFTDLRPVGKAL